MINKRSSSGSILMNSAEFILTLEEYLERFHNLSRKYNSTSLHSLELQQTLDEYSAFITNPAHLSLWEQLNPEEDWSHLVAGLRRQSAHCVAIMEKYRALNVLRGSYEYSEYFKNIESCIEQEFGGFQVSSSSKVLLVGSGSFPMTPLLIAKRTGAAVLGIDIDDEAIHLGRSVLDILGPDLQISLTHEPAEKLDFIKEITHIIFSSTVEDKFNIMDRLHELTHEQVIVAMRYGNQLKSLSISRCRKLIPKNGQ